MKMISLKNDKKKKNGTSISSISDSYEKYPWGTTIEFNRDVIKKLGLDGGDLMVGSTVSLSCVGEITSVRATPEKAGIDQCSIQLTDVIVTKNTDSKSVMSGHPASNKKD